MTERFDKLLRSPIERLALEVPDGDGLVSHGLRLLLSVFPGGGALKEMLAFEREEIFKKDYALFRADVATLEERVGAIEHADAFLATEHGKEHVSAIFGALEQRKGEERRRALAAAYVSGIGYGRFAPNVVLVLDETLVQMNSYHVQVVRWCYERQHDRGFKQRYASALRLADFVSETGYPVAVVQKVVSDLAQRGVVLDTAINRIGPYWGVRFFVLTSFGMMLARYIIEPEIFTVDSAPDIEDPFADSATS